VNAADFNTAAIDQAATRITIAGEVARTYLELCAARAHAQVMEAIAATRRRQFDLAETRLRLHLASRTEIDRARAEWQAALSDVTETETPVAESEAALSVLLGRRLADADLPQTSSIPTLTGDVAYLTPADLVRTRPEIRRAEQNVLHAAGELGIARADLYPRFSIVGTLISSTALTGDVDRPNKAVPLIAPSISLPILDWHARRAVVGAREAALDAAVLAYRQAVLEGVAEVETAIARFQAKTALVAHADEAIETATRAFDTATTSRRIGVIDDADVMAAKIALEQSQLQRLQAVRERGLGYIALYKAFGGSMPPLVTPR
jgi:outer membrane protein TolC